MHPKKNIPTNFSNETIICNIYNIHQWVVWVAFQYFLLFDPTYWTFHLYKIQQNLTTAVILFYTPISMYLEHTLMSRMLLQFNQTIQNDQLDVVVALLDDQVNVALRGSLECNRVQGCHY